jgi:hypothetical protein
MSAGAIFSVLSNIPWAQVVENAPKVAEAAGKLWTRVARRNAESAGGTGSDLTSGASESQVLRARLASLEAVVTALQDEMRASSQLIKDLAEQNTVLIQRIELARVKLVRLAAATALGFAVVLALVAFLLTRA